MATSEVALLRVRRAYELGMARAAFLRALPVAALSVIAAALEAPQLVAVALGSALFVIISSAEWYGRAPRAGVRAGLLAGLVPYASATLFRGGAHLCTLHGVCLSWCALACALGGAAAAVIVVQRAGPHRSSAAYFWTATLATGFTGSIACACAGGMSALALATGFLATLFPARAMLLRPVR